MIRKLLIFIIFLTSIFFILPQAAQAATYYVDDVNGNDTAVGDSTHPWKTIPYTWSAARGGNTIAEGDTILFKNGNYGDFIESANVNPVSKYHFHRTNWITYRAATGHSPILAGITVNNRDYENPPTYLPGGESYLIFDGFTIPSGDVSVEKTSYIKILNCKISGPIFTIAGAWKDWYIPANSLLIGLSNTSHVLIENCDLQKDFRAIQTTGNNDVTIRNTTMTHLSGQGVMASTNELTVEGCAIEDIDSYRSDYPIYGTVSGTFITGDAPNYVGEEVIQAVSGAKGRFKKQVSGAIYVYQTTEKTFDYIHTITGQVSGATVTNVTGSDPTHINGIYIMTGNNVTIQRNKIISDSMNLSFYVYNVGDGGANYYVANNLIVAPEPNYKTNEHVYANVHIEGVSGMTFVNNTVLGANGITVRTMHDTDTEVTNFYNNITTKLSSDTDHSGHTVKITNHGNNIFGNNPGDDNYKGGPTYPFVVNGTELVSQTLSSGYFTNYSGNDFNLLSSSSAVNFGNATYAPSTDILGNSRVGLPDAGCYEYGASTFLYGDVSGNGEVSSYDAALTAQYSVGLITLTPEQIRAADVSGNGEVSAYDAALIAQRAVGLIEKFPVEE